MLSRDYPAWILGCNRNPGLTLSLCSIFCVCVKLLSKTEMNLEGNVIGIAFRCLNFYGRLIPVTHHGVLDQATRSINCWMYVLGACGESLTKQLSGYIDENLKVSRMLGTLHKHT